MNVTPNDADLNAALAACDDEPIHIPGIIQPVGCLIGFEHGSGRILYVSENLSDFLQVAETDILGKNITDLFGAEITKTLIDRSALPSLKQARERIGKFDIAGNAFELHAFADGDTIIVEMEPDDGTSGLAPDALRSLSFLMDRIYSCDNLPLLLRSVTEMLQRFSGYDRVMVYQFDSEFNGEVVAESLGAPIEPFDGLRFPSWDIPTQARAIMMKLPLRFVSNVDQEPVPIRAASPDLPPLDISHAHLRGVSPIHLQYLRNMESRATMTLSIVVEERLWGIVSFHHCAPKLPSLEHRQILTAFTPLLCQRLHAIQQAAQLKLANDMEGLKANIQAGLDAQLSLTKSLASLAPTLLHAFNADGIAMITADETATFGQCPSPDVIHLIVSDAQEAGDASTSYEDIAAKFPKLANQCNGIAGSLTATFRENRAICLFREPTERKVSWAGSPAKDINVVDGQSRLEPRGSFALYLETVKGRSQAWKPKDHDHAERLWSLLIPLERQSMINTINRQQGLMIDELNHRVRNILALIRSVSRQTGSGEGTGPESAAVLEARISALANAHDIGFGASIAAVPIREIIESEAAPYRANDASRLTMIGAHPKIDANFGPLLALVIHELVTNSVKYGALKSHEGRILIDMKATQGGLTIGWKEQGGPPVKTPTRIGFGTHLIQKAVPFELRGKSKIDYEPDGLRATIWLPSDLVEIYGLDRTPDPSGSDQMPADSVKQSLNSEQRETLFLIVEDNFLIAADLSDTLEDMGFGNTKIASHTEQAIEIISEEMPGFAILDINLGNGETTYDVATQLRQAGVGIIFVTGYGENMSLPENLSDCVVLTKPVMIETLEETIVSMMLDKDAPA